MVVQAETSNRKDVKATLKDGVWFYDHFGDGNGADCVVQSWKMGF